MNWKVVQKELKHDADAYLAEGYVEVAKVLHSLSYALLKGLTAQPEGPDPLQLHKQQTERHPTAQDEIQVRYFGEVPL